MFHFLQRQSKFPLLFFIFFSWRFWHHRPVLNPNVILTNPTLPWHRSCYLRKYDSHFYTLCVSVITTQDNESFKLVFSCARHIMYETFKSPQKFSAFCWRTSPNHTKERFQHFKLTRSGKPTTLHKYTLTCSLNGLHKTMFSFLRDTELQPQSVLVTFLHFYTPQKAKICFGKCLIVALFMLWKETE